MGKYNLIYNGEKKITVMANSTVHARETVKKVFKQRKEKVKINSTILVV